jgi:hypothetical protein
MRQRSGKSARLASVDFDKDAVNSVSEDAPEEAVVSDNSEVEPQATQEV